MPLYVKTVLKHVVAKNSDLVRPSPKFEETRTFEDHSQVFCRIYEIPGSTVDKVLPVDGLVGKSLFLSAEKQLSVKLNGSGDALLLGAAADEGGELCLSNSNITSISVTNSSTDTVELQVSMSG